MGPLRARRGEGDDRLIEGPSQARPLLDEGQPGRDRNAAVEGAVLRLRPIMMTMLVATLGLLPAAMSHAIGSDSQRPFAIVIVGGLMAALIMSIFLLPCLYVWMASDSDVLLRLSATPDHSARRTGRHRRD